MSTTSEVHYRENALVIKFKTACPAATHHSLLRGLITAMKLQMQNSERIDSDVDGLVTLANVLSCIMPNEFELSKAFTLQTNPVG